MEKKIFLTTTTTGKKSLFTPQQAGNVTMYVCGITPYDYAHAGHGRCYVTFDLLYRLLNFLGYSVTYCRNFTDIDDKLLNRAEREFADPMRYTEVATRYIDFYKADMDQLGCVAPKYQPRVTDHIPQIIALISGLIEKGYAYEANGSVYYRVKKFAEYGKLSHRDLDDLKVGARVLVSEEKEDPLDFALWKAEDRGTFWESPWGWGRPGWHIECSALALHYLGQTVDIHGGGMDLIFPHHENEIAQSEGLTGKEFANYWIHNAFVRINQEKMSKSLGNFFTLRDLFARVDPMVVRYYILTHHYRSPLDFSWDDLEAAQKSYQRLCKQFSAVLPVAGMPKLSPEQQAIIDEMVRFLLDDLNTPGLLGVVFEHLQRCAQDKELAQAIAYILNTVMGLALQPLPEKAVEMTPEIQALLEEREAARRNRDFKRADQLRDQLREMGFDVQDVKIKK